MLLKLIKVTVLSLLLFSCKSEAKKQYELGFQAGKEEAYKAIKENKMTIYTAGKVDQRITHDKETGLKLRHLGCIIDSHTDGLYHGFNSTIKKHLKNNKP